MSRALRRHHRDRLMRKRRYYHWSGIARLDSGEPDQRWVSLHTRTPKPCSCWMCGHVRRLEGPTIAERRFFSEPVD